MKRKKKNKPKFPEFVKKNLLLRIKAYKKIKKNKKKKKKDFVSRTMGLSLIEASHPRKPTPDLH